LLKLPAISSTKSQDADIIIIIIITCISGLCFGYLLLYFVLDRILQHGVIWRQLISKPVTSKQ